MDKNAPYISLFYCSSTSSIKIKLKINVSCVVCHFTGNSVIIDVAVHHERLVPYISLFIVVPHPPSK